MKRWPAVKPQSILNDPEQSPDPVSHPRVSARRVMYAGTRLTKRAVVDGSPTSARTPAFVCAGDAQPMDTHVSDLLRRIREGDPDASAELMPLVYAELRRIAAGHLRRERAGHTLQPTALINEAYLRLFASDPPRPADRAHFLALASQVMRRILVDYARARRSDKRGGDGNQVPLEPTVIAAEASSEDHLLELDLALDALASEEPRLARAIELHYFGGLTAEEAAEVTGRSVHAARHDLRFAHAWLRRRLAST